MQTTAPLQKEAPHAAVTTASKATINPLQLKVAEEEDDALQMKGNLLQLQTGLKEEDEPLQMKQNPLQLIQGIDDEEEPLQTKQNPLQLVEDKDDGLLQKKVNRLQLKKSSQNPLQPKPNNSNPLQLQPDESFAAQGRQNNTGLPDNLKTGIENLSGYSMDDVKVHYNSDKPAQLQALAYAQGTEIHIGPGQEKHLPHEAWHVVQQKQERVQPTMQMKGGIGVNDDKELENEADAMGAKVLQFNINKSVIQSIETNAFIKCGEAIPEHGSGQKQNLVQRKLTNEDKVKIAANDFSKGFIAKLWRNGDLEPSRFGGVYKAYRSDRPGIENFSFSVIMKLDGKAFEYHAHVSLKYEEQKGKIQHRNDLKMEITSLHKSHLKSVEERMGVGNLVDLSSLEFINTPLLVQYKPEIFNNWFDKFYKNGTERDRSDIDDRHAITNPSLNLMQWSKSLIEGRIKDLFITIEHLPNHVTQVNQEFARLRDILQSNVASDAGLKDAANEEIEKIKKSLFTSMSNAKFADIDYQQFQFPTIPTSYFGISKSFNKVNSISYSG